MLLSRGWSWEAFLSWLVGVLCGQGQRAARWRVWGAGLGSGPSQSPRVLIRMTEEEELGYGFSPFFFHMSVLSLFDWTFLFEAQRGEVR